MGCVLQTPYILTTINITKHAALNFSRGVSAKRYIHVILMLKGNFTLKYLLNYKNSLIQTIREYSVQDVEAAKQTTEHQP